MRYCNVRLSRCPICILLEDYVVLPKNTTDGLIILYCLWWFLPFSSLVGVPLSGCSNDSTEVLLSLLTFTFELGPEVRPWPFLSPIPPATFWVPLAPRVLGSQGEGCDWLPVLPGLPWLGILESIWAAVEGDMTGGDRTMASVLGFGLKDEEQIKRHVYTMNQDFLFHENFAKLWIYCIF